MYRIVVKTNPYDFEKALNDWSQDGYIAEICDYSEKGQFFWAVMVKEDDSWIE